MQTNYEFPRVEVPNLSDEERSKIEAVKQEMDWHQRMSSGFLRALLSKGVRPFVGKAKPAPRPTKHQRHMTNVKARSAYLRSLREA